MTCHEKAWPLPRDLLQNYGACQDNCAVCAVQKSVKVLRSLAYFKVDFITVSPGNGVKMTRRPSKPFLTYECGNGKTREKTRAEALLSIDIKFSGI